jgi:hypothetical protein
MRKEGVVAVATLVPIEALIFCRTVAEANGLGRVYMSRLFRLIASPSLHATPCPLGERAQLPPTPLVDNTWAGPDGGGTFKK